MGQKSGSEQDITSYSLISKIEEIRDLTNSSSSTTTALNFIILSLLSTANSLWLSTVKILWYQGYVGFGSLL